MSSVFLGQKSHSSASKDIFTSVLSLSNKGIGLSHPPVEDKPSRNPFSVKGNSKVTNYSFIQHLSEIPYLDIEESRNRTSAAGDKYFPESKPSGVPQISVGKRTCLFNDHLGLPSSLFIQHSFEISHRVEVLESIQGMATKHRLTTITVPDNVTQMSAGEIMRVKDQGTDQSNASTSSSGPRARAVGCINRKTVDCDYLRLPNHFFPPSWRKERMGVDGVGNSSFTKSLKNDNGKSKPNDDD